MNKPRILYVSYDGLTDPLGQSQVLPYLTHLSQLNYEVTILSTEKKNNFEKRKDVINNICEEAGIHWEYVFYTKTPPVFSTVRDVWNLKNKAKKLNDFKAFQIIHCRSYIAALIGLFMKRKFGLKFIFDMRGFWADERVDGGLWDLKNPIFKSIYKFFKKKEVQFLKDSDAIVSLTYNGKNEILSWPGMNKLGKKITVIPCCADLSHFDYKKTPRLLELKENLKIPVEDKVIVYLGSVGTWYMLDEMLQYFKSHLEINPKTSFLWITKDDPEHILSVASKYGVQEKIVIKGSERKDLPSLLSICDASIFFIKPLVSKKASSPTKKAELLGMGIPIICNSKVGDTEEILAKEKAGIIINSFEESVYLKVAKEFESLCSSDKEQLRSVAQKYFSLEEGVEKYNNVYKELLNS